MVATTSCVYQWHHLVYRNNSFTWLFELLTPLEPKNKLFLTNLRRFHVDILKTVQMSPSIESCNWIDFISVAYASWYHWNCGRTQRKAATINQFACPSYSLYVQLLWYKCIEKNRQRWTDERTDRQIDQVQKYHKENSSHIIVQLILLPLPQAQSANIWAY